MKSQGNQIKERFEKGLAEEERREPKNNKSSMRREESKRQAEMDRKFKCHFNWKMLKKKRLKYLISEENNKKSYWSDK